MTIPKITRQNIIDALKQIDKEGVPFHNQSVTYDLVTEDGKKYPPKYVIIVATKLANGENLSTEEFNSIDAYNFLQKLGFTIETRSGKAETIQQKFELTITADSVVSTDERFTMDNLSLGDNYKPLYAYFMKANGEKIERAYNKGERRNSNQTLPRIACQVFEKQIAAMSIENRESFPVCKYKPNSDTICGIYTSVDEFKKHRKTLEFLVYNYDNGRQFVLYCWNIFSTIIFVQECLKRFGEPGDQMILVYREKEDQEEETDTTETSEQEEQVQQPAGYRNPYSDMLLKSKNLIFHGAPGTGKSYLAKEIAADIVSNGYYDKYARLSEEQKQQVEFVQFHPSYDYADFVEGLRPTVNDDGAMGFELQDGVFKKFVARARKNYEDSQKSTEVIEKEVSVQESMDEFFSNIEPEVDEFETVNQNVFKITSVDDKHINISIPGNAIANKLSLKVDELRKLLETDDIDITKGKDISDFFKRARRHEDSYYYPIYKKIKEIMKKKGVSSLEAKPTEKNYIFIIDEINRGEISKIFGELFFAIDPGYRGEDGAISTQYANMHSDPNEKFYIPKNVYIIGTMNDIDRSVDSFDFAMRRRFRFVELKADDRLEMLASLNNDAMEEETIQRMSALNKEIAAVEDLNENYQIGPAYFLKLKDLNFDFDRLWTDYLQPLLQEYVQGMYDEKDIMDRFAKAYGYKKPTEGEVNETAKD